MNRRLNRREVAALWLAGVMLVASPAIAHHVNEPTAAITDIKFTVLEYGSFIPAECGDTVSFRNLRVHVDATVDGKPSEHWTTRYEVRRPDGSLDWQRWPHQNIAPHGFSRILQANVPLTDPGVYQIRMVVTGDESGNRIERTCLITKG